MPDILIAIAPATKQLTGQANSLAKKLKIPSTNLDDRSFPLHLVVTESRLELQLTGEKMPGPVFVDFDSGKADYRRRKGGGRKQTIVRAVGVKGQYKPAILDATAGLGRDAFVLASQGCRVTMCEQNPILAALLEDGLDRAAKRTHTHDIIYKNMILENRDSLETMNGIGDDSRPDVVYLDPMFPHRTKSALVKKEMQVLQFLIGADQSSDRLLKQALKIATKRVVVKRPSSAPPLKGPKPDIEYKTKKNRFDAYLINS